MAKANDKDSLMEAVSKELKSKFDLNKFKEKKLLSGNVKFKEQKWIPFSKAMQDALSIPGIAMGHINIVRGGSNTGKTTTSIETAVSAQKMGILPVLIITEMKHSWEHWKTMGFEMDEVKDDKGNVIDYEGFFLYRDRGKLNSIEDVAEFILDMLNEQDKGNLPYDLLFLWDSVGSIACRMSIEQGKNNPMWNAGAIATQFGNFINQRIILSRKEESKHTNTFLIINKTGVAPAENVFSQPRMTNKGGNTFYYDASLCLTFGNVTNSGTSKIKAQKDGKDVEFALRTKVSCDKNHVNGITTKNTVISTVHGFIPDDPKDVTKYKKEHSHEWAAILGEGNYKTVEDNSEWNEKADISDIVESED
jgi:RecA/RadA recombinase